MQCSAKVETRLFETRRCLRDAVEFGFCHQHLPLPIKRQREKMIAQFKRSVTVGLYWFWTQVAIAALCAALTKAGYRVPTGERR